MVEINNESLVLDQASRLLGVIADVLGRFAGPPDDCRGIANCRRAVVQAQLGHSAARDHLDEPPAPIRGWAERAFDEARRLPEVDGVLLGCIEALLPHSGWIKRNAAPGQDADFVERHRHAMLIGAGSSLSCESLTLGLAVMEPGVRYPYHQHPPGEFYVVLSEGLWFREGTGWWRPGPGGIIYNTPSILHSMESGERPLLALWGLIHP
ncbi:dimethylsulfonioproprionate lyase family protein [Pseudomonas sp. LRF_L74]|uniref:dimethylsulfonioproprionate lyase family protein n=1 Tax=Pseudomonas sp. LRF_L74 TaxID=3369422 RepID=UPI003F615142